VLAAAIKAGAQVIVTSNLKHFPAADLRQWDVEAKSPDDFVLDQIGIDGGPSLHAFSRSPIRGAGRRRTQRTYSASSNVTAWSDQSPPCAPDSDLLVACRVLTRW
jgi:hypothetical protein